MCMPLQSQKPPRGAEYMGHKVVYIAGPMTGIKLLNRQLFDNAEKTIRNIGYVVLNPAHLPVGMSKDKYMPICLSMIDAADIVCMLPGHEKSNGASIELAYAKYQNKTVTTYNWLIGKEVEE